MVAVALLAAANGAAAATSAEDARVAAILKRTPLIDGHNDWAEALRGREATPAGRST